MLNHIHIIAVPNKKESLARAIGGTHCKCARIINFGENWRGKILVTSKKDRYWDCCEMQHSLITKIKD